MSFLRRLLTRPESEPPRFQPADLGDQRGELPAEALTLAASGGALEVVGESHYRDAIQTVTGGPRVDGIRTTMWATLVAEHDNPYDPHAVAVHVAGRQVGHLRREDAAAFWPLIDRIRVAGRVAYCRADIYGGWNRSTTDRGDYSVTLYAAGPDAQAAKLARELEGRTRAEIAAATPSSSSPCRARPSGSSRTATEPSATRSPPRLAPTPPTTSASSTSPRTPPALPAGPRC